MGNAGCADRCCRRQRRGVRLRCLPASLPPVALSPCCFGRVAAVPLSPCKCLPRCCGMRGAAFWDNITCVERVFGSSSRHHRVIINPPSPSSSRQYHDHQQRRRRWQHQRPAALVSLHDLSLAPSLSPLVSSGHTLVSTTSEVGGGDASTPITMATLLRPRNDFAATMLRL